MQWNFVLSYFGIVTVMGPLHKIAPPVFFFLFRQDHISVFSARSLSVILFFANFRSHGRTEVTLEQYQQTRNVFAFSPCLTVREVPFG